MMELAPLTGILACLPKHVPVQLEVDGRRYLPGELHSYRGYYECLAVDLRDLNPAVEVSAGMLYLRLVGAVGQTFEGWKGGEYTMSETTRVFLAHKGHADGGIPGEIAVFPTLIVIRGTTEGSYQ